jgi:hypothetical protein
MSNATTQITGAAPTAALTTQNGPQAADPKRWLILAVVALAQLMVVLDRTSAVQTSQVKGQRGARGHGRHRSRTSLRAAGW